MSKTKTVNEPKILLAPEALLAMGRLGHLNLASNKTTEALRADVQPGDYKGEVTVRLVYDIRKGEDHEADVAQSVPWKAIAGILFGKLNATTRDAVVRDLLESAEGGGFQLKDGVTNDEAEEALATLMGTTRKTVSGKVTGSAVLLPVEG